MASQARHCSACIYLLPGEGKCAFKSCNGMCESESDLVRQLYITFHGLNLYKEVQLHSALC
jgi:hypothetical protein